LEIGLARLQADQRITVGRVAAGPNCQPGEQRECQDQKDKNSVKKKGHA